MLTHVQAMVMADAMNLTTDQCASVTHAGLGRDVTFPRIPVSVTTLAPAIRSVRM